MNQDKVITMLLKQDKDIEYIKENIPTRDDICGLSGTLDKLVKLAEKKDQGVIL